MDRQNENMSIEKKRHFSALWNYLRAVGVICKYNFLIPFDRARVENFFANILNFDFRGKIESVPFVKLFPESDHTRIVLEGTGAGYTVSPEEARIIASIVQTIKPKNLFEFGTNLGATTLLLAMNAPEDSKIFTLDLPPEHTGNTGFTLEKGEQAILPGHQVGERFANHSEKTKITQLFLDSARLDETRYREQMDLIFVDGSHAYSYVKSDTE